MYSNFLSGVIDKLKQKETKGKTSPKHRYVREVDCCLGQFKSAKLKNIEYSINVPIFVTTMTQRKKWMH